MNNGISESRANKISDACDLLQEIADDEYQDTETKEQAKRFIFILKLKAVSEMSTEQRQKYLELIKF